MLPPRQLVIEGDTRPNTNNNYAALKLDAETRWRARFKYLLRNPNPLCREALKELDYRGLHLRWLALVRTQRSFDSSFTVTRDTNLQPAQDDHTYLASTYIQFGMMLDIHLHPAITQELAQFSAALEVLIDCAKEYAAAGFASTRCACRTGSL